MNDGALMQKPVGLMVGKVLRVAGRPLRLIPSDMRMRVPVGINRGLLWVRGSANAPEWLGIYEYRKQRLLRRILSPGQTVCDVGANAGFYTLGMARMIGPNGRVIAFEPLPANLGKIRRHLEINKIDNVTLCGCALSDKAGRIAFDLGENDFTGRISEQAKDGVEVCTISLDEFISQEGVADPTFLKIDVEGAEAKVLAGARALIQRAHPSMLIALHGQQAALDCYAMLREAGYVVKGLNGAEVKNSESIPAEILAL